MQNKEINLCTICARKGSKGVKNKNLQKIGGISLLERSIIQAINSRIFNKIVVTTDSNKVIELSQKYKIDFIISRSSKLSNDKTSKIDVIKDALLKTEARFGYKFDNIIDIDLTTPLRKIIDIKKAFKKFKINNLKNLLSVCEAKKNPYFNILEVKNKKIKLIKNFKNYKSRQDAPKVYEANSAIYIWKRNSLLSATKIIYPKTGLYVMPRIRSIDIDDNLDLLIVKKLFN